MSIRTEFDEVKDIVTRTLANLIEFSGKEGRSGAELRLRAGDLVARAALYVGDGTFANRLLQCFRLATTAGISLDWMDRVIQGLTEEKPTGLPSTSVVQNSLIFALAQEARIIRNTIFESRDDVDATMQRMKSWFEIIKDIIADTMSGPSYQDFVNLTAAITRYLTDTARPLPRMLHYNLAATQPALFISNYIYGEGDRSNDLVAENKIVHPAFAPRRLRAISV